jgi:hypothetical protein
MVNAQTDPFNRTPRLLQVHRYRWARWAAVDAITGGEGSLTEGELDRLSLAIQACLLCLMLLLVLLSGSRY